MPIWGLSLRQEERLQDQEEEVWLQIQDLIAYLQSLQQAGGEAGAGAGGAR
jgi:hypothetical protein